MKKLIAIALLFSFTPALSARSQTQALPAAVAACYAQPLVCTVVVGATAYIIYRQGKRPVRIPIGNDFPNRYPTPQARPSRGGYGSYPSPNMKTQWTEMAGGKNQREAWKNCVAIAQTYREAGRNVEVVNLKRAVKGNWLCVFQEM